MADKKVSELTAATTASADDVLYLVRADGSMRKLPLGVLADNMGNIGLQANAVANATSTSDVVVQLNTLLVRLRELGLIAS